MKKLLFVSSVSSVFHIPLWRAFESFGYEVHFVDYRGHPFLEIGNIAHRALHRLPAMMRNHLHDRGNEYVNKLILKTAHEIKPDLIFTSKAKYISLPVLDELRTIAPTVNWYVDQMSNWRTIQDVIGHYDILFNYDRYVINLLKEQGHKNAYHLPWCGYLEKDAVWPDKKVYKHNLVFIGSFHPSIFPRVKELEGLKKLGIKVWGNGWENSALRDCHQGVLPPIADKIQDVYRESKIAIYLDSLYEVPGTGITLRPFEITAAGAMMLSQSVRSEFPELFKYDEETVVVNGLDEMKNKAEYYLTHEDERRRIAKNGFERTRSDHTYYDRVRHILDIVHGHH
jgi:spore maturation protein CgeB